ncbi:helix-turn-helix domain-containing protein [Magnetococcus sp. PR-3]|uniref:helix-turn-helix domain-containing protein n=1 Tax=Magnetococcus sp. PR-3 TaxID=3120355 RepID=UPI003FA551DF
MPIIRNRSQIAAVGDRLRAAREAVGCSQKSVCDSLDAHITTWNKCEKGKRMPGPMVMVRLQARFRISLDWIYAGDPSMLPFSLAEKVMASAHG